VNAERAKVAQSRHILPRIYNSGEPQAASLAVFPDAPSSIPNIGADFLCFTSKIVEHSRYLPVTDTSDLYNTGEIGFAAGFDPSEIEFSNLKMWD
jgi:hypothetical protein